MCSKINVTERERKKLKFRGELNKAVFSAQNSCSPSSRGRQSEPCTAQSTGGTDGARGHHLARDRGAPLNYAVRATETKMQGFNSPAELEGNDSARMIAETAKGNDQQQLHVNSSLERHPSTSVFPPCLPHVSSIFDEMDLQALPAIIVKCSWLI
jgi:hypothetical protein